MIKHISGFPRMGVNRELKKALESHWKGDLSAADLAVVGDQLKLRHWQVQQDAGLSYVATGDFSYYDHVLDTSAMLGAVPERFGFGGGELDIETYFRMARGDSVSNVPAMEMTKWFDSNYHYIVPEFRPDMDIRLASRSILEDTALAVEKGFNPKPTLLGPITYLCLGKEYDGADRWSLLDDILVVYAEVISHLSRRCEWIQIDEPILCTDMPDKARELFVSAFNKLKAACGSDTQLLLAGYFGAYGDNLELALAAEADGLHCDLVRAADQLGDVLGGIGGIGGISGIANEKYLSLGLVDGRNIWKSDLGRALDAIRSAEAKIGSERLMISASCSLQHSPIDITGETVLDPQVRSWMSFAVQKCREVAVLGDVISGEDRSRELAANAEAIADRRATRRTNRPEVRDRVAAVSDEMLNRPGPYSQRKQAQAWLKLPILPTTTIGSFPQTPEIRATRLKFKRGEIDQAAYEQSLHEVIRDVVQRQEQLDLDVLVHGEPERNDMVEYFGQQMDGFCFTANGWVQSFGSRCVKPPVIYGDVSRPKAMTIDWITYAQSLTDRPMKGMLTGPVTILCWSFVRDDLPRSEVCRQIALAVRDEVADLEAAGVRVIQIDEAALREGLPLRKSEQGAYLRWAVDSFRLAANGAADSTQIHTHMCYSEFNAILDWIIEMDADVISIESSRSRMELLDAFETRQYPNEIGPGVYDIHSPRVPTTDEMVDLLRKALKVVPLERLWVNPDCGLKTRRWPETTESLKNMVEAAKILRKEFS